MKKTWNNLPEKNYLAELKDAKDAKNVKTAGLVRLYVEGGVPVPGGGEIRELTPDDYDYPENNPVGVALWRLPDGIYHSERLVGVYTNTFSNFNTSSYFIKVTGGNKNATQIYTFDGGGETIRMFWVNSATGECQDINKVFLKSTDCIDWLNSTAINRPLSAKQGKVLNEKIESLKTTVVLYANWQPNADTTLSNKTFYHDANRTKAVSGSDFWNIVSNGNTINLMFHSPGAEIYLCPMTNLIIPEANTSAGFDSYNPEGKAKFGNDEFLFWFNSSQPTDTSVWAVERIQ